MLGDIKNSIEKYNNILIYFLAFFTTVGINMNIDSNIDIWQRFSGNSILYFFIFIFLIMVMKKVRNIKDKRMTLIALGISILFAMIKSLESITKYFELSIPKIAVLSFLAYIIFFYCILMVVLNYININCIKTDSKNIKPRTFFIFWGIIFICWIPYLLKYFPGITSIDPTYQIYQALGKMNLSNHHPICHTFIIYIFFNLFNFNGNYNISLAVYSVFQMLVTSAIYSFSIYYMLKRNIPKRVIILSVIYFALNPVMAMYSITVWKDILFSASILLYTIGIYELITNAKNALNSKKYIIFLAISIISTMIFKHNGFYIVVLSAPIVIILLRKYWKKLTVIYVSIIIIYYIFNNVLLNVLNVAPSPSVEALSIPVQQIARVVKYNGNSLEEEEINSISKFMDYDKLSEAYNPRLADPVKMCFNNEAFAKNKMEFIKLWISLFFKYPKTYINSFLSNTYGYWYPETSYWMFQRTIIENDIGLEQNSIINVNLLDGIVEERNIPVISMLFSIGFIVWVCIVIVGYHLYKKDYKKIVIFLPVFILWLTAIASSVFCEFRYLFGIFTCAPIFISTLFREDK